MKQNHASNVLCWVSVLMAFVLCPLSALAADRNPPELMTYQGYLTDGDGRPLGDTAPKNYDVVFRIWDDQSAGNQLWTEHQTVTVDKGYFSVLLGEGAMYGSDTRPPLSTLFADAANASDRFIEIIVRSLGSPPADVVIQPRLRLLTSPYAFLARNAVSAANLVNSGNSQIVSITGTNVGINKATPSTALDVNGTLTANGLTLNGPGRIYGQNVLEFGIGRAGKGASAGKIGYQWYDNGLNISGAGADGARVVSILAENGTYTFGGVGVNKGTITAGYKLDVNGAAHIGGDVTATGGVTATSFTGKGTIPLGGIIMWSGATVPTGWHLCDGGTSSSGVKTPDLRNRFIAGSGSTYAIGAIGGAATHTNTIAEMPAHTHGVNHVGYGFHDGTYEDRTVQQVTGTTYSNQYDTGTNGSGQAFSILPPYYALAYIMRVD